MSGNATLTIVASMNASAAPAQATSSTADGFTVRRRTTSRAGTSVTAVSPGSGQTAIGTRPRIRSAARSATMIVGAFVFPPGMTGMTDASATRSPSTPWTRRSGSTTAMSSDPIRHVPTGW